MSRSWIFQANPSHYDIDAALAALDKIWWRTPQHATDICAGDIAVIWRSGAEAGIVGVGRVLAAPQLHSIDSAEHKFVLDDDESRESATRALLAVQRVPFVSKERVRAISEVASHRILVAPMGTVFPLTVDEWNALAAQLPVPPEHTLASGGSGLAAPFSWEQRAKGVMPMPGGYDGYLAAARRVCEIVGDLNLTSPELVEHLGTEFDLKESASRLRESFLRKMGLFIVDNGTLQLSGEAKRWMEAKDDRILVALLHSRCQFIGEMIAELRHPLTTEELLAAANDRYGSGWDTKTQIDNRRGWLQSAGMIAVDGERRLVASAAGLSLIAELVLRDPAERLTVPSPPRSPSPPEPSPVAHATVELPDTVDVLVAEIEVASTDSGHPDRFERVVRDAFSFLGFDAQLLGGSGRTDVLLEAPLGRIDSYRVTVDAKTTASGSLGDQQVDWATLVEHRERHKADHTLLVGPNPSSGRLMDRAQSHGVAVLSARQLAGLCRQHSRVPLGLQAYRTLFQQGGEVATADLDELAQDTTRLSALSGRVCNILADKCPTFGRLTARDLWLMLASPESGDSTSIEEIQDLLSMLGHPLVAAVEGSPEKGYVLATDLKVTRLRLELLAAQLGASGDL